MAALTDKVRGVRAIMYAPYLIDDCIDTNGLDSISGPSYWVALVSASGASNAILQIGVVKCMNPIRDACNSGSSKLFWAYGGCNGYVPYPRLLSPTPSSGVELNVKRLSNGYYKLYADGVEKASIYKGDAGISCWADTGDVDADVSCERWDSGDMCGTSLDRVSAHGVWYQNAIGGSWNQTSFHSGSCQESNSETQCAILDENSAQFWTAQ